MSRDLSGDTLSKQENLLLIQDWPQNDLFIFLQEVNESPEILKYIWYPELEIYGLDTFGRQRVLKEMSGVRVNKNKTITYELG